MNARKSTTDRIGKWLTLTTTAVTIIMTAFNVYLSYENSKVEASIKQQAIDLDNRRLELDSSKERLLRYEFVQKLLSNVLTQDSEQKNLTVNLISLALTESEAQRLFAGLQASDNQETRKVGMLGSDVVVLSNLVLQMNDAMKENRQGALQTLINNYRGNSAAVDRAIALLESPSMESLSSMGRINVLVFLSKTDPIAWTKESISRATDAISAIPSHVVAGPQTADALNQLSAHLEKIKQK